MQMQPEFQLRERAVALDLVVVDQVVLKLLQEFELPCVGRSLALAAPAVELLVRDEPCEGLDRVRIAPFGVPLGRGPGRDVDQ